MGQNAVAVAYEISCIDAAFLCKSVILSHTPFNIPHYGLHRIKALTAYIKCHQSHLLYQRNQVFSSRACCLEPCCSRAKVVRKLPSRMVRKGVGGESQSEARSKGNAACPLNHHILNGLGHFLICRILLPNLLLRKSPPIEYQHLIVYKFQSIGGPNQNSVVQAQYKPSSYAHANNHFYAR